MHRELSGEEIALEWRRGYTIVVLYPITGHGRQVGVFGHNGEDYASTLSIIFAIGHSEVYSTIQFCDVIVVDASEQR